jgi:hypothetical protein
MAPTSQEEDFPQSFLHLADFFLHAVQFNSSVVNSSKKNLSHFSKKSALFKKNLKLCRQIFRPLKFGCSLLFPRISQAM